MRSDLKIGVCSYDFHNLAVISVDHEVKDLRHIITEQTINWKHTILLFQSSFRMMLKQFLEAVEISSKEAVVEGSCFVHVHVVYVGTEFN